MIVRAGGASRSLVLPEVGLFKFHTAVEKLHSQARASSAAQLGTLAAPTNRWCCQRLTQQIQLQPAASYLA